MPAYNFKKQFAPLVESGKKRQTIRRPRKRPTRPGDTLYLYTGLRTKQSRKLIEVICTAVEPITIYEHQIAGGKGWYGTFAQIELAWADGFDSISDFREFFRANYGLPFRGEIIKW